MDFISPAAAAIRVTYSVRWSSVSVEPRRDRRSAKPCTIVSGVRRSWTSETRCSSSAVLMSVVGRMVESDLAALERDRDRVDAVARLELADDVAHVGADGFDAHADLVGDRVGRAALGHQVHDLALSR